MGQRMATWVLWGVINSQRRMEAYAAAQRERRWAKDVEDYTQVDNAQLRVGILGLGSRTVLLKTYLTAAGRSP